MVRFFLKYLPTVGLKGEKKSQHFGLMILLEGQKWHKKIIKPEPDPDEGGNKKLPPNTGRPNCQILMPFLSL